MPAASTPTETTAPAAPAAGIDRPGSTPVADLCCAPVLDGALSEGEAEALADAFKALADPVRLRLLSLVASAPEVCACELVEPLGRSQPTVSHHLKVLRDAGLVVADRRGSWIWYRVVPERVAALRAALT